jgi:hypothetical protein
MVRASRLLKVLPYLVGILLTCVFLVGTEISSETAALADAQQAFYAYPIDVQVFWLQGKACVILPPDGHIANCSYVPLIPVMLGLTFMMVIVLVIYGLLRKRVNLLTVKRAYHARNEEPFSHGVCLSQPYLWLRR